MAEIELTRSVIPKGEDPHLDLRLEKHGIEAVVTITLHFEGDWSNIYDDEDESEEAARVGTAEALFGVVLNSLG